MKCLLIFVLSLLLGSIYSNNLPNLLSFDQNGREIDSLYYSYSSGSGRLTRVKFNYKDAPKAQEKNVALPRVNTTQGPADLGIYYVNAAGVSCGGLKTAQCSTSCGSLGYPVYWCYPKVCLCHYGTIEEENNIVSRQPADYVY